MSLSCKVCNRPFGTSQALQQHERDSPRHVNGAGNRATGSQATRTSQGQGQQQQQQQGPARPPPSHPSHCSTCQKSFKSSQALEQHQRDSPRHAGGAQQQEPTQPPRNSTTAPSAQQPLLPASRPEPVFTCAPCVRSFGSAEALEQHRHDAAAHAAAATATTGPAPTPLDVFFGSFAGFAYDAAQPPATSYARLKRHQRWARDSAAAKEGWCAYQEALRGELTLWYGAEDDLAAWHALCRAVGVEPPGTCDGCARALRNTHVNIVDLIDWNRNPRWHAQGQRVCVFRSVAALREYSKKTGKIFSPPSGGLGNNVVLRHLLRIFFRGGLGSR